MKYCKDCMFWEKDGHPHGFGQCQNEKNNEEARKKAAAAKRIPLIAIGKIPCITDSEYGCSNHKALPQHWKET